MKRKFFLLSCLANRSLTGHGHGLHWIPQMSMVLVAVMLAEEVGDIFQMCFAMFKTAILPYFMCAVVTDV